MKLVLVLFFAFFVALTTVSVVKVGQPRLDPATREMWRSAGHASLLGLGALAVACGMALLRRMWQAGFAEGLAWDIAAFGPLTSVEEHARRRSIRRRQGVGALLTFVGTACVWGVLVRLREDRVLADSTFESRGVGYLLLAPLLLGVHGARRSLRNRATGAIGLVDLLRFRFRITGTETVWFLTSFRVTTGLAGRVRSAEFPGGLTPPRPRDLKAGAYGPRARATTARHPMFRLGAWDGRGRRSGLPNVRQNPGPQEMALVRGLDGGVAGVGRRGGLGAVRDRGGARGGGELAMLRG